MRFIRSINRGALNHRRLEWVAALLLATASVIFVGWVSRNLWFYADIWEFLTHREIGSFDDLMRPHLGHWITPGIVQTRVVYGVAGMDFWPLHFLSRLLGWSALSVFSWWVIRRRGADMLIALGALVVLLVLGSSWLEQSAFIGTMIAIACLIGVAMLTDSGDSPRLISRIWVFLLLLLSLMSSGVAIAGVVAVTVGLLAHRKLKPWLLPIAASAAIYVVWWFHYDVSSQRGLELSFKGILAVPQGVTIVLQNALSSFLGLSASFGPVLLMILVAFVWRLGLRGKLGSYESILLLSAVAFAALVAIARPGVLGHDRYALGAILWLVPAVVPHIRIPSTSGFRATASVVILLIATSNVAHLVAGTEQRAKQINAERPKVEAAATLIAAGEPFLEDVEMGLGKVLTAGGVAKLVNDGWNPQSTELLETERAALRMMISEKPDFEIDESFRVDLAGAECLKGSNGRAVSFAAYGKGVVRLHLSSPSQVRITWDDEFGQAVGDYGLRENRYLRLIAPAGGASITIRAENAGTSITVCRVP